MRGVETAIFANDACGAPIPWDLCCPWLFFDGKLFQYKLHKAMTCSSLKELCDGKVTDLLISVSSCSDSPLSKLLMSVFCFYSVTLCNSFWEGVSFSLRHDLAILFYVVAHDVSYCSLPFIYHSPCMLFR